MSDSSRRVEAPRLSHRAMVAVWRGHRGSLRRVNLGMGFRSSQMRFGAKTFFLLFVHLICNTGQRGAMPRTGSGEEGGSQDFRPRRAVKDPGGTSLPRGGPARGCGKEGPRGCGSASLPALPPPGLPPGSHPFSLALLAGCLSPLPVRSEVTEPERQQSALTLRSELAAQMGSISDAVRTEKGLQGRVLRGSGRSQEEPLWGQSPR